MELNVDSLAIEVQDAIASISEGLESDGERLHSNYQKVVGWILRFQEIHNEISIREIHGDCGPALRKFRTSILDPTIERLEKVAAYESRKITARTIEAQLER